MLVLFGDIKYLRRRCCWAILIISYKQTTSKYEIFSLNVGLGAVDRHYARILQQIINKCILSALRQACTCTPGLFLDSGRISFNGLIYARL